MAWSSAVFMTGSSFGEVIRISKVVITWSPTGSFRETYTPGWSLMWSMVKLVIFSMIIPHFLIEIQGKDCVKLTLWKDNVKLRKAYRGRVKKLIWERENQRFQDLIRRIYKLWNARFYLYCLRPFLQLACCQDAEAAGILLRRHPTRRKNLWRRRQHRARLQ